MPLSQNAIRRLIIALGDPGVADELSDMINAPAINQINEGTAGSGVTIDGFLIKDGGFSVGPTGTLNLAGVNNSLTFDADGDTTLSAETDDLLNLRLNGAIDFVFGVNTFTANTGSSIVAADADKISAGGVILPQHLEVDVHCQAAADCVDRAFFVANRAYQVVAVRQIHATAEASAGTLTIQVVKDTGTSAPAAGTDLLTNNSDAGFDGKGTANTVQTGTLTGTTASLRLAAGDRLSLEFSAAATELAGVHLTVTLKRI